MATTQLNVRIDADLKAAGDAVLERFGVSSVQVVRKVWQYMADHQRLPELVLSESDSKEQEEAIAAERGAAMAVRLAREAGLRADLESMSFAELRESAYEEMLLEETERHA